MEIKAKKIKKSSLFKLILIGTASPMFIFFIACGIASYFGAGTVTFEEEPVTGLNGLLLAIGMYPVFTFFLCVFAWTINLLGFWIYSLFKDLKLEFTEGEIIDEQ